MRKDRTCQYCEKLFLNEDGKVFANHVRWCDKNKTNGDKGISKRNQTNSDLFSLKFGEIKQFEVTCCKCEIVFAVKERENKHPERDIYFCSRSCANSRGPRSEDFKEKVRAKLSGRIIVQRRSRICEGCRLEFQIDSKHPKQKCCSVECSRKVRYGDIDKESLKYYRRACSFKFNLADYPGEFDFGLVEQYGWYAAKNRGDNLCGVSRDHIISVKYGFENNVDVSIISHPANCRLMVHNSNVSKGKKCGMTLEQLEEKIKWWNEKYISRLG
jgi:hypothetical protein